MYLKVADEFSSDVDVFLKMLDVTVCGWRSSFPYEVDDLGKKYDFVTLTSSGVKEQGAPYAGGFKTEYGAVGAYFEYLYKYVRVNTGVLLWRMRPALKKKDCGYVVVSRLVFVPHGTVIMRRTTIGEQGII